MEREGLIGGKCSTICEMKAEIAALQERINGLYNALNGLQGDGTGNLQITAGPGIQIDTRSGNEVRISGEIVEMDDVPTQGSERPVKSGGVYAADAALSDRIVQVSDDLRAEGAARISADTAESAARIAADNALGDRIDKVIDGTTPPVTISGVLPIQNGGTGSSTKNFVDLTTALQEIPVSKKYTRAQICDRGSNNNLQSWCVYNSSPAFSDTSTTPITVPLVRVIKTDASGNEEFWPAQIYTYRSPAGKYQIGVQIRQADGVYAYEIIAG